MGELTKINVGQDSQVQATRPGCHGKDGSNITTIRVLLYDNDTEQGHQRCNSVRHFHEERHRTTPGRSMKPGTVEPRNLEGSSNRFCALRSLLVSQ